MAGIVIIGNKNNEIRQTEGTEASWMLRAIKYQTHYAANTARMENTSDLKWLIAQTLNTVNAGRQAGGTAGSWAARQSAYGMTLRPEHTWNVKSATLKESHPGSDYSNMRFMQDNIPANNLILKNKNNEFIEFVNAKIDVIKQNTIIETALVNRRGKIKEYITALDYEIKITGDIMVSENYYPTYEIGEINDFLSEPDEFDIVNTYLEAFEITKVVFKNGNFNQQKQKHFNVLPFDFTFVSDEDTDNAYGLIIEN